MTNVVIKLTCNNFLGVNIEKITKFNVLDVFLRGLLCYFIYFIVRVPLVLGGIVYILCFLFDLSKPILTFVIY